MLKKAGPPSTEGSATPALPLGPTIVVPRALNTNYTETARVYNTYLVPTTLDLSATNNYVSKETLSNGDIVYSAHGGTNGSSVDRSAGKLFGTFVSPEVASQSWQFPAVTFKETSNAAGVFMYKFANDTDAFRLSLLQLLARWHQNIGTPFDGVIKIYTKNEDFVLSEPTYTANISGGQVEDIQLEVGYSNEFMFVFEDTTASVDVTVGAAKLLGNRDYVVEPVDELKSYDVAVLSVSHDQSANTAVKSLKTSPPQRKPRYRR